ncbi:hypothetical protein SIO70_23090 [Chitinophaga sancti]|uniref:hypothetical protein n=1 Tax=Chitinophaga sancti TaxID=1004 RepID=UPI002A761024|nr:hypothetical protein [Chitinophaga sancti]WPQ61249.1 hypothetical protein SIO70_23090 [Chitinophaga sancti]
MEIKSLPPIVVSGELTVHNPPPSPKPKKIDLEGWLKIIGIFLTAISLYFTSTSIKNSQTWKVAEFTANEFKKFSDLPNVKIVNSLLDYNQRTITGLTNGDTVVISDDFLTEALLVDSIQGSFTPIEAKIRDALMNISIAWPYLTNI